LPTLAAFVVSMLASVGGLSGAFLLLPFQVSVLGFAGPAASATNLLYNVIAIPGGVYRHCREKRMVWSLAGAIIMGTVPGMFIGAVIRVKYLPEAGSFKIFAGLVLLYLAAKLIYDIIYKSGKKKLDKKNNSFVVKPSIFNLRRIEYEFNLETVTVPTVPLLILSFIVGVVGGAYGIGGGAIIVPYLVAFYAVPVHTLAGAALFSTFAASVAGVGCYLLAAILFNDGQPYVSIKPDWMLGLMLGIGGFAGIYVGSRIQKYLPARLIKIIIAGCMSVVAFKYLFW
jgi:uncharacterized membrane protein YfcA